MPQRLKFDRTEASRLRAEGWGPSAIARQFGVTRGAIKRGLRYVSPRNEFMRALSPEALADYRMYKRAHFSAAEARSMIQNT